MGVTRLKRKEKKNKTVAKQRQEKIKFLTRTPLIKKVDIEELKKQHASGGTVKKVKEEVKHLAEEVSEKASEVKEKVKKMVSKSSDEDTKATKKADKEDK